MFDNERNNGFEFQENTLGNTSQPIPPTPGAYEENAGEPYQASESRPDASGWQQPADENNCTYHYVRPSVDETKYSGYQAQGYENPAADVPPSSEQSQDPYSSYQYSYQRKAPMEHLPNPPVTPPQSPKQKKKKEKRSYSLASMVAVSLASALICGVISSSAVVVLGGNLQNATAPTTSQGDASTLNTNNNKTVYVNETAEVNIGTAYNKAAPSVVGIRVSTPSTGYYYGQGSSSSSEGSGVVYTSDGYIITNYHVISSAVEGNSSSNNPFGQQLPSQSTTIEVFLADNPDEGIAANIVGYDASADLAILKINKTGLTAIEIGDSDSIQVGEKAIAIGNPGGLDFMGSVSSGIISGLNRKIQTEQGVEMNLIQTDAAINPGNSGGALVNINGQLIGINNSKMAGENFEGMGFAIPVNEVVEICDRLIKNENAPTPYIGITANSSYDAQTLQRMGYPAGVVVYSVSVDSPAADAGIQRNDIITKFNGVEISSYQMLNSEKNKCSAGDTVTVTVYRNGQSIDLQVTLGSAS